jgi:SAM-dependent methyltransferase
MHSTAEPPVEEILTPSDTYAAEARIYDSLSAGLTTEDLPFYLDSAKISGGPVLELACGTGRILVPVLAALGAGAGVDASPSMIDQARQKAQALGLADNIRLEVDDIRTVDLRERYPLVMIPYSSLFQLATEDDLITTLRCAKRHLAPDGKVVTDVFVPNLAAMQARHDRTTFVAEVEHPDTAMRAVVWDHTVYAWARRLVIRRRIYETLDGQGLVLSRQHSRLDIYFRHPPEMLAAFENAGLTVIDTYGDFDRRPFDDGATRLILTATA